MNHDNANEELLVAVIPAYNEEGCIAEVVGAWRKELAKHSRHIVLVINDGSRDRTGEILFELASKDPFIKLINKSNSGHGASILTGYKAAIELGGSWVFQVDSDNQFSTDDFSALWEQRTIHPIILGHRELRKDPPTRRIISGLMRTLISLLFCKRLKDPNTPFRLLRADVLKKIIAAIPPETFAPNIFISVLAAVWGVPNTYIAVTHKARKTGQVSIVGIKLLRSVIKCAYQ
jgi:glycosyltransferase involved in cell wall biosynthesis